MPSKPRSRTASAVRTRAFTWAGKVPRACLSRPGCIMSSGNRPSDPRTSRMQIGRADAEKPGVCLCPGGLQLPADVVLPTCPIAEHTGSPGPLISRRLDVAIAGVVASAVRALLVVAASKIPV